MIVVACIRIGVKEMMKSVQILGIFWRWKVRMCWQRKSIRENKQKLEMTIFLGLSSGKERVLIYWLVLGRLSLLIFSKIVGRANLEVQIMSLIFEILTFQQIYVLESCMAKSRVQRGLRLWYIFGSFQHKKFMGEIIGKLWYEFKRF